MQVVTANAFKTGEVVYAAPKGWVDDLQLAQVFTDEAAVATVINAAQPHQVVGAYAIEVEAQGGQLAPRQYREVIRATGPTNYRHGKAEEGVRGHVSL
ncbi:MAG: DUF2849 domain-containing protein [Alphaproteobacteria bacterium]|nr:DUF2849 domain-containing protein [Alphaproteobacteria bacterium]